MIPLPKWIRDSFKNSLCPYCGERCKFKGVYSVGIREEDKKNGEPSLSFFFEYSCEDCNQKSVFTGFRTNYDDFIDSMIEIASLSDEKDQTDSKAQTKRKKEQEDGMSDKETSEAKKIIDSSSSFSDLLGKLGITDQFQIFFPESTENDVNEYQ